MIKKLILIIGLAVFCVPAFASPHRAVLKKHKQSPSPTLTLVAPNGSVYYNSVLGLSLLEQGLDDSVAYSSVWVSGDDYRYDIYSLNPALTYEWVNTFFNGQIATSISTGVNYTYGQPLDPVTGAETVATLQIFLMQ